MMENIWQVNGEEEIPCSICCLGCESANSLEENHGLLNGMMGKKSKVY